MQRLVLTSLFTLVIFLVAACSNQRSPTQPEPDNQTFSDPDLMNLQLASTFIRTPRLVVQLSIQNEVDSQGNPTGKRYGQAAFFWTDKSAARGGSDLSGSVGVLLREAGQPRNSWAFGDRAVLSNLDLLKQADYLGHIVKTNSTTSTKPLCIEILNSWLSIEPDASFMTPLPSRTPIVYCEANLAETKTDLQFTSALNFGVKVAEGMPAILSPLIMNTGPRPAKDVYVKFKVNDIMRFVEEKSGLFECSSRALEDKYYREEVSCYARYFPVGVRTLPLVFERTPSSNPFVMLPITGSLQGAITTSSTETNYTNNSAGFSAIFEK
jgi:hypothetical protein